MMLSVFDTLCVVILELCARWIPLAPHESPGERLALRAMGPTKGAWEKNNK